MMDNKLTIHLQELENPLILIHNKKISDLNFLVKMMEIAVQVIILEVLFLSDLQVN